MDYTVTLCKLQYLCGCGALRLIQRWGQQFDDDDGGDGVHGDDGGHGEDVHCDDDDVSLFISLK